VSASLFILSYLNQQDYRRLYPTKNGAMIHLHPALIHHFCYLPVGKRVAQVPANAQQDDFGLVVTGATETAPAPRHLNGFDLSMKIGANGHSLSPYHLPLPFLQHNPKIRVFN